MKELTYTLSKITDGQYELNTYMWGELSDTFSGGHEEVVQALHKIGGIITSGEVVEPGVLKGNWFLLSMTYEIVDAIA